MNKVFHIDDGEQHWIVANSEESALNYHYGTNGRDYIDVTDITEMGDSELLTIRLDEYPDQAEVIKSCKEWVEDAEKDLLKTNAVCIATTCY